MKTNLLITACVIAFAACEKPILSEEILDDQDNPDNPMEQVETKRFTFTVKGDFASPTMRGYLTANDNQMTDLWVYDFMGDACVQSLHQAHTDADWGVPQMQLKYGTHHVYFVASRGTEPTVDDVTNTISWSKPSDTF